MPFRMGPLEIGIILVIILIIFGVGKLPQVGDALGKGIRAFRKGQKDDDDDEKKAKEEAPKVEEAPKEEKVEEKAAVKEVAEEKTEAKPEAKTEESA